MLDIDKARALYIGCGSCDFEEADGSLIQYCPKCSQEIAQLLLAAIVHNPPAPTIQLLDYVNGADIGGADAPSMVVAKLQASIDRGRKPTTLREEPYAGESPKPASAWPFPMGGKHG